MFGLVTVQLEQNSSTSTRFSWPVTVGVNVWPAQLVFVKPKPVGLTSAFFASVLSGWASVTLPGLPTRSQLLGAPRWNVACVLSVKQPAWTEADSVKFFVSVPPFGTPSAEPELGSKPGFAAETVGYAPAGTVNE